MRRWSSDKPTAALGTQPAGTQAVSSVADLANVACDLATRLGVEVDEGTVIE